jgi:tetratricopeptide (TPR) repeat protein
MAKRFLITLLVLSTFLCGCLGRLLEEQQAQIQRQQEELERLRQETEALFQSRQKEQQEQEACNRAFYEYEAARKTKDPQEAIARYRQGLQLCPDDDVARNELGELYLQQGQRAEAITEFTEALRINPNFSRAQKNLQAAKGGLE